jgi:hypothetical protein
VTVTLLRHLRGPFNFVAPETGELERLLRSIGPLLPPLRTLQPERLEATPLHGYPVLRSRASLLLRGAVTNLLQELERAQLAETGVRDGGERASVQRAWEAYRQPLSAVSENLMAANYGRGLPQIFWLWHAIDIGRALRGSVGRIRALNAAVDRQRSEALRYHVLFRYLDRVFSLLYELASALAKSSHQREEELFPRLLVSMRDNVLIFTEDHISRDLSELSSYFRGYLNVDGPQILYRFALLRQWHQHVYAEDPMVRAAAEAVVGPQERDVDRLLNNPSYLDLLASHPRYSERSLMPRAELELWQRLLGKLKEFEVLNAARRLIVELQLDSASRLVCEPRAATRVGGGASVQVFSGATRPIDFGARWVIDPAIELVGLIYDIKDFSEQLLALHRSERIHNEDGLRRLFLFQQQVNRVAGEVGLRWEKHLGDGAFYTVADPRRALIAALAIQRVYRRAVAEGLSFDRGLRIGLNSGSYRQLPLSPDGLGEHYEIYGYGLVELTRLVSGKKGIDVEELVATLVSRGYTEQQVREFFQPFQHAEVDLDRPRGGYGAQLTGGGALINEGIVATQAFLSQIERRTEPSAASGLFHSSRLTDRVLLRLGDFDGESFVAAIRRLGEANFKGLGRISVYDIVDAPADVLASMLPLQHGDLLRAIDDAYMTALTR